MSADTPSESGLDLSISEKSGHCVAIVSGRIDHTNADRFQAGIGEAADAVPPKSGMIIDLSGLEYITSAGLRTLMLAHRKLAGDRMLVVSGISGVVKEVFRISKFDALLSITDTQAGGIAMLSDHAAASSKG
ncbi:MAG: STAS domain-containing protein [Pseudomonadota bacterium]